MSDLEVTRPSSSSGAREGSAMTGKSNRELWAAKMRGNKGIGIIIREKS